MFVDIGPFTLILDPHQMKEDVSTMIVDRNGGDTNNHQIKMVKILH
jgi:hypothetical protein